jgi:hypothetical protein
MLQPQSLSCERRRDVRRPAAFPFWIRRADGTAVSAWMLNMSLNGAAFLIAQEQAPRVGERLICADMASRDHQVQTATPPLPPRARVLRVEDDDGTTRRVAVRFEPPPPELRAKRRARRQGTGFTPDSGWRPDYDSDDLCLAGENTHAC